MKFSFVDANDYLFDEKHEIGVRSPNDMRQPSATVVGDLWQMLAVLAEQLCHQNHFDDFVDGGDDERDGD